MDIGNTALFALAVIIASISPGPNVLNVVIKTMSFGVRGAVYTVLGNLISLFCIALLAAIGVGTLFTTLPWAFIILKIAGGLYLGWLGLKLIKNSFAKVTEAESIATPVETQDYPNHKLIIEGLLISASNPKSVLFLSAVFPQFLSLEAPIIPQFAAMFATIIICVSVIHGIYAICALKMREVRLNSTIRQWLARATGVTFIGLGASVMFSK